MQGWKIGEQHQIRIGFSIDEPIDDGWQYYDTGTKVMVFNLTPAKLPTATPTAAATATPKPKPTNTKSAVLPTNPKPAVPPTSAPAGADLVLDMTVKVTNNCPEEHKVVMQGPMKLKYTVAPGQTVEYQAAQGTYTWMIDGVYPGGPQDLNSNVWTLTLCR